MEHAPVVGSVNAPASAASPVHKPERYSPLDVAAKVAGSSSVSAELSLPLPSPEGPTPGKKETSLVFSPSETGTGMPPLAMNPGQKGGHDSVAPSNKGAFSATTARRRKLSSPPRCGLLKEIAMLPHSLPVPQIAALLGVCATSHRPSDVTATREHATPPMETATPASNAGRFERRTRIAESAKVNANDETPGAAREAAVGRAIPPKLATAAPRIALGCASAAEMLQDGEADAFAHPESDAMRARVPFTGPNKDDRRVPSPATTIASSQRGHSVACTTTGTAPETPAA